MQTPHPRTTIYFLLLTIAALCALLFWKGCERPERPLPKLINTDSIAKSGYDQGYKVAEKKIKATVQHDTVYKKLGDWNRFKSKTDTIRDTIFREAVATCDEALMAQNIYIGMLQDISAEQDTLITTWRNAYRGDSANVAVLKDSCKVLNKAVKRERNKKRLWQVIAGITTLANGVPR